MNENEVAVKVNPTEFSRSIDSFLNEMENLKVLSYDSVKHRRSGR